MMMQTEFTHCPKCIAKKKSCFVQLNANTNSIFSHEDWCVQYDCKNFVTKIVVLPLDCVVLLKLFCNYRTSLYHIQCFLVHAQ